MSPLVSSDADNSSVNGENKPDGIAPNQQEAFYRVCLYLKTLHLPEEKARDLTREAFRLAGSNSSDTPPALPEAMRALRELLKDQLPFLRGKPSSQHDALLHENLSGFRSMPLINRGSMVPAAIDLIPWRTSLVRSLKKTFTMASRPLNFLILFIFLVILFVLLTFWR